MGGGRDRGGGDLSAPPPAPLSIVVPVYDEGDTILRTLEEIEARVRTPHVVLVVYDREEDTTLPPLRGALSLDPSLPVRPVRNLYGRGALNAIRTGLELAGGEAAVVVMADLADDLSPVDGMFERIRGGDDLVCGSRYMPGGRQIGGPLLKRTLSRLAGVSLHHLAGVPTRDVTNSFKMYSTRLLRALLPLESTGGFELGMELTVRAHARGFRISELPATWRDRTAGTSRFRLWAWLPHYLRWYGHALRHGGGPAVAYVTWLLLAIAALAAVARWGRNLPLAEDWLTVAALTGHEPDLPGWLWAQNNEHRLPLPRLLHLAALRLSGGDYRSGMVLNVLAMSAASFTLLRATARARGGPLRATDAVIPLLLLHLGHWENLVWGWQIQFVSSAALACLLLAGLLEDDALRTGPSLRKAGIAVVLLPLCGASGVVLAAACAPWAAWRSRRMRLPAVLALFLCAAYFVGYRRPEWVAANPGPLPTLAASAKLTALGAGPAASLAWAVSVPLALALVLSAAVLLARARRTGLLAFLLASGALVLALGWGRAGVPQRGYWELPIRYALLAAPLLVAAHLAWSREAPARWGHPLAAASALLALALLPLNTIQGFRWRDWYVREAGKVERDLRAGLPLPEVAARHQQFLLHWDRAMLVSRLEMLREARMGPFREAGRPRP